MWQWQPTRTGGEGGEGSGVEGKGERGGGKGGEGGRGGDTRLEPVRSKGRPSKGVGPALDSDRVVVINLDGVAGIDSDGVTVND